MAVTSGAGGGVNKRGRIFGLAEIRMGRRGGFFLICKKKLVEAWLLCIVTIGRLIILGFYNVKDFHRPRFALL